MEGKRLALMSLVCAALCAVTTDIRAQRVQFPGSVPPPSTGGLVPVPSAPPPPATTPLPGAGAPWTGTSPPPSSTPLPGMPPASMPPASMAPSLPPAGGSGATLGTPAWDPYASPGAPGTFGAPPPAPNPALGAPPTTQPWRATPPATSPDGAAPPAGAWPYGAAAPPPPGGYYAQPGQPSALFPNGFFTNQPGEPPLRLLDDLAIRHTWVAGGDGLDVGTNDTDLGLDIQFPNFFGTTSPLIISPQFTLSLWDGPAGSATQQLPANAYAALLEASWNSNPALVAGADLAVSVGVFSDFNSATTDSIRIQTLSYGWVRLTPQLMLKLGVNYIDRVDLALLPAVGFLWEPNPQTKFDIFFPKPKISRQFSTVGTTDVWLYVAAEYGGGSWTIEHWTGTTDQIDINDIRLMVGFDWFAQSGMRGMFEVGWVTSRDVVYRYHPSENFSPGDSFMLRAGLAF